MRKLGSLAIALAATLSAAPASAERLFGLTAANTIVTFDSAAPATITSNRAILGVAAGDVLTGLDLRASNRTLYSVARSGNLYRITSGAGTYTATLVGDIGTLNGARVGIDFNPVPDRLRLVTDFDQNFRINVDNASTIVDGAIDAPGAEALVGVAYTNNRAGATATTLFALDAGGNQLLRSTNPNAGTYIEVGTVGNLDFGGANNVGFDISGASGAAFFNIGSSLYSLNLTTAAPTLIGTVGSGPLIGITAAAVPEPATWAMMIGGVGLVGGAARRRRAAKLSVKLA